MTAEIIPIKQPDHLSEIQSALLLLKLFNMEGGHSPQVIDEMITKGQILAEKLRAQLNRR
ncbi:hypothetical protein [Erwinia aphidicola]|uniref:hypothetical protein n=1 Tax=Erwinia aphidicola TaxID=68334 RepID=UPI003019AA42